jgi:hypothetical protein
MLTNGWRYLTSALVLFLLACVETNEPGPGPNPAPVVARVAVTAPATTVLVGATMDLTARAHDAQDQEVTGLAVTWSSDKPAIASVSAAGRLEAKAEGAATITATIQGKSGIAAITVTAPIGPVTRIAIEPGDLSLEEGAVRELVATAYDAAGHVVPNQQFVWQSSDETVIPVSTAGVVTALRPGTGQITVIAGAFTAHAAVDVWAGWGFDLVYDELTGSGPQLFALDVRERAPVPQSILSQGTQAWDPTPSPDGSRIAFVVFEATSNAIYVANRDGSNALRLTPDTGFADQPAWSPDGTRLAYRYRKFVTDDTDIWVVDNDGRNAVNRTADFGDASNEREPAWNGRIAFVRVSGGTQMIWSMLPDGIGKRRVTVTTVERDEAPSWSPDGLTLAFLRDGHVWTVSETGANARPLITLGGTQKSPTWSPDGKLIAFASSHEAPAMLYTVWADGTRLARRSGGADYLGNLAWRVR